MECLGWILGINSIDSGTVSIFLGFKNMTSHFLCYYHWLFHLQMPTNTEFKFFPQKV